MAQMAKHFSQSGSIAGKDSTRLINHRTSFTQHRAMDSQTTTHSRKRGSPNKNSVSPRLWAISALALSFSYFYVSGFQGHIPTGCCSRGAGRTGIPSPTRSSTVARKVVTDPNQLVKAMIDKQSLQDRATLEDLYRMSSDGPEETGGRPRRPGRRNAKLVGEDTAASSSVTTSRTRRKMTIPGGIRRSASRGNTQIHLPTQPRRQPAKTLAMMAREEERLLQQGISRSRSSVGHHPAQFKGLTTGANPRNTRRKSLSNVSPTERNPTLLRDRIEERRAAGWSNVWEGLEVDVYDDNDDDDDNDEENDADRDNTSGIDMYIFADAGPPVGDVATIKRTSSSGKSSTMPGFMERSNSNRQKAYRDGIKLAKRRLGETIIETPESVKRRGKKNAELMYKTSESVPESLMQFAGEIHSVERITPKEEVILGEKTQEAIKLQKVYDGLVDKLHREPTDEEWCAASGKINMEAIMETIEEGLAAKNKLVTANLRMVQGVVNVYIRNGLRGHYNAGDLMQEGIMALIRAAEKFDPSRGFRFSTYAMYWIRSAIKRDQIYQSRVIQVPQRLQENYKRVLRIRKELASANDRPPTVKELSQAVGMTESHLVRCITSMQQKTYSLDQNIVNHMKPFQADNEADTLYSLLESKTDDSSNIDNVEYAHLREDLIKALHHHLSEEDATLLLLRFGLIDGDEPKIKDGLRTIAEVGKKVGLKPDKVRRTLNRSLNHLQLVIGDEWREYERELSL